MIYLHDHPPAHVHAVGPGNQAIFWLNCPAGPIAVRANKDVSRADESALIDFLTDNLDTLCRAWEEIHDHRTGA
jgi:hypothetical protein